MLGESKWEIFKILPKSVYPKTNLFNSDSTVQDIEDFLKTESLTYPFILKPDIGERGWMVEKIDNANQLAIYLNKINVPFLLQEFVDLTLELGVFYVKFPGDRKGKITSITQKGFLSVVGDGRSDVRQLLKKSYRATTQFEFNSPFYQSRLKKIPSSGEVLIVEEIGNHSRGTTFLDATSEADDALNQVFNNISEEIPDFYFGRFDLRANSFTELKENNNWKILELNGAGAEPSHIYDPNFRLLAAYRVIIKHLSYLSTISRLNSQQGFPYISFTKGLKKFLEIRRYNRLKSTV